MENKKSSRFGLGLILGSILGGVTALFVAPKTGKEMREMAKRWLAEELERVKKEVGKIDKKKYQKAVEKVLQRVRKEIKNDVKELSKIKKALMEKWSRENKK